MKRRFLMTALLICALIMGGCTKDSSTRIVNSYTYKISGTVTLMADQLIGLDATTLAAYKAAGVNVDPVVVGLYPEQGQLHIVEPEGSEGKIILTFNDLLGNADVADGTYSGSKLTLAENQVKAVQLTDGKDKIGNGMVIYSGQGEKYDNMLVIDLTYSGKFTVNNIPMTAVSSDVHCVAQEN